MYISIPLIVAAAVLAFIFFGPYRRGVIDFLGTVWEIFLGIIERLWNFLRGAAPAGAGAAVGAGHWILRIFLILAVILIIFTGLFYSLIASAIVAAGYITGHWHAATALLVILLIWGMLSAIPAVFIWRPIAFISRWVVRPAVLVLFLYLAAILGWQACETMFPSFYRWANNKMVESSNKLDQDSLQKESSPGTFIKVTTRTEVYNKNDQPFRTVEKGTTLMVLGGKKATSKSEGMIHVMLPNSSGDFIGGDDGRIPSRVADWNWKKPGEPIIVKIKIPGQLQDVPGYIGPGRYHVSPPSMPDKKIFYTLDGEPSKLIEVNSGRYIAIPPGRELWAIGAPNGIDTVYLKKEE